ncbi:MAG: tetratricopeptide repeat-containing glycosyltransferase family protein [Acetobacterales bacterium]
MSSPAAQAADAGIAGIRDCLARNRAEEAATLCRAALEDAGNVGDAHRPDLLGLLGYALSQAGDREGAIEAFREATTRSPANPEHHANLGAALVSADRTEEAATALEVALRLFPHHANALYNLGLVRQRQWRLEEAVQMYRRAMGAGRQDSDCAVNLGIALKDLGAVDLAVQVYRDALAGEPDNANARYNLGIALLLNGEFAEGWRSYESRWRQTHFRFARRDLAGPVWDGRPMEGRTLLLQGEQGMGDVVQFARYAAVAKQGGARVILRCRPRLLDLMAGLDGADMVVSERLPAPAYDAWAHLMSLPHILGTTPATVPAATPYLHPDQARVAFWRRQLHSLKGVRIGIGWQGDPGYAADSRRSIPLPVFAALARIPGVVLVSLQKGPGRKQMLQIPPDMNLIDLGPRLDEGTGAFVDTAAVMRSLNLIVTSDTALAHVAGATGRPVWLGLPHIPDWRWMLGREDSPWYPTMRLFRQPAAEDWEAVFARMAERLRAEIVAGNIRRNEDHNHNKPGDAR